MGAVAWGVIAALGAGTLALRVGFILFFGRLEAVPPAVERTLRFVPPAVLAALVAPRLVYLDGALALGPGNERLLAGAVAAAVAWRFENLLATILAGMGALWAIRLLAG